MGEQSMSLYIPLIIGLVGALLGFALGSIKFFREQKQKVYGEMLPVIIRAEFRPENKDEKEFNEAICKLLLYGNKDVVRKLDDVLSIMIKPTRGNVITALQELIEVI